MNHVNFRGCTWHSPLEFCMRSLLTYYFHTNLQVLILCPSMLTPASSIVPFSKLTHLGFFQTFVLVKHPGKHSSTASSNYIKGHFDEDCTIVNHYWGVRWAEFAMSCARLAYLAIRTNHYCMYIFNDIHSTHRIHGTDMFVYIWLKSILNVGKYTYWVLPKTLLHSEFHEA